MCVGWGEGLDIANNSRLLSTTAPNLFHNFFLCVSFVCFICTGNFLYGLVIILLINRVGERERRKNLSLEHSSLCLLLANLTIAFVSINYKF